MAYPTVRSYSTGVISSDSFSHTITLPPTISAGDMIVVFISENPSSLSCTINASSSSNFKVYDVGTWNRWVQSSIFSGSYVNFTTSLTTIVAWAIGGGSDVLVVDSVYVYPGKERDAPYWSIYAKPSYICYSLANVRATPISGVFGPYVGYRYRLYGDTSSNWNMDALFSSGSDDSDVRDYLWLLTFATSGSIVASGAPSGFTNLVTAQGSVLVPRSSSLTSCRTTTNAVSNINPGACTAASTQWIGTLMKFYPADESDQSQVVTDTSVGVGTYVYKEEAYVYTVVPATISVTPDVMDFDHTGTIVDPHFGTQLQVISTGNWTAAWTSGLYFTAFQYSGVAGVTYVDVHCVNTNPGPGSYTDTLTFTCGAIQSAVSFEEYAP